MRDPAHSSSRPSRARRRPWPRRAALAALLAGLLLLGLDALGVGPNLGLPVGYHGRLNRILARLEARPDLEVTRVDLHRDTTLEDFFITVRTRDEREVVLRFLEASTRPWDDLLGELDRVDA